MQIEDYENTLMDKINALEDELMEIEMLLQEALNQATGQFTDEVKRLNSELRTKTMDYIKEVGTEYENFTVSLKNGALIEQEQFEKLVENMENESQSSEFNVKLEVVGDRDILIQWLEASKEFFEGQLAEKERYITKSIMAEWEGIEKRMLDS
jgi:allophanate hydrolase subunit 1